MLPLTIALPISSASLPAFGLHVDGLCNGNVAPLIVPRTLTPNLLPPSTSTRLAYARTLMY